MAGSPKADTPHELPGDEHRAPSFDSESLGPPDRSRILKGHRRSLHALRAHSSFSVGRREHSVLVAWILLALMSSNRTMSRTLDRTGASGSLRGKSYPL